jgi:fucose permease
MNPSRTGAPSRGLVVAGFAAFLLLGWSALLVPSLIREVQGAFGQDDAGMGLAYLVSSLLYVVGSLATGVLPRRVPRPLLLGAGPGLVAAGLAIVVTAGAWPVFLAGYACMGIGSGIIDAGVNALFMDLYPGRAAMLNRLHLFYALGALASPLAVGLSVGAGAPWRAVLLVTAAAAALVALAIGTRRMPAVQASRPASGGAPAPAARRVPLPLVALAVAIACYVAAEIGTSSWLVRYLEEAPLEVATLALSLFWAGIGLSRLVASFFVDRVGPARFTAASATAFGAAMLVAIVVPSVPLAVACFAVAGFAAGPIFPVIMAIGGGLYPGRGSTVSSVLTSAAIVGSIVYPPLMGVLSETAGLVVGMAGAAAFAFASGATTLLAVRLGRAGPAG